MIVTRLENTGNSAKYAVEANKGSFIVALSFTLRTGIWKLDGIDAEQAAAQELAEAIVSRHNPKLPFSKVYVFGEHNSEPTLEGAIKLIRKYGYPEPA